MNDFAAPVANKIGKLLRLLSSEQPGEVLASAHALMRTLEANGLDVHALAKRIEDGFDEGLARSAFDAGYKAGVRKATASSQSQNSASRTPGVANNWWNRLARKCWQQAHRLTEKERAFTGQMSRCTYEPSEKQANWLRGIAKRLGVQ